jgi:hypothetical protein
MDELPVVTAIYFSCPESISKSPLQVYHYQHSPGTLSNGIVPIKLFMLCKV